MKELFWTDEDKGYSDYVIDAGIILIDDNGFYRNKKGDIWLEVF